MDRMQMAQQFRQVGFEVHTLGLRRKSDLAVALRLRTLLRRLRPDILHTYLLHANVLGRVVGRLAGVPTIIGSETTIGQAKRFGKLATKLTNPLTNAVTVNSEAGGAAVTANLGVPLEKLEVVLPGLDVDAFGGLEKRAEIRAALGVENSHHLVLYAGRFRSIKGVEYGIRAFARALAQQPDMHLALAGEGEQRGFLIELASHLGITEKVTFLGVRNDLADVMSAADSILMPSLAEGFPRVALEAMASSKPVIATRVGGTPEAIIHEETGILVDSKDIDAMAAAIVKLSSDPNLQTQLGAAARQRVEQRHSITGFVARLDELYQRRASSNKQQTSVSKTQESRN
jgi:glycosyltransferase involved in cell wall biosynthesis